MTGSGMAEPSDWVNSDAGHVLTERKELILGVISDFAGRRGYAPTLREIAKATGLASPSSVSYQLTILQDKEYLRRDPGRPRTIETPGYPASQPSASRWRIWQTGLPHPHPAPPTPLSPELATSMQAPPTSQKRSLRMSGNYPENSSVTGRYSAFGSMATLWSTPR